MINLYLGDCMGGMKDKPENFWDLAIVDPEYGIKINNSIGRYKGQKKSKHKKVNWDNKPADKKYFDLLFIISKNQIIWGGNYFSLPRNKCFVIWDKLFSEDLSFSQYEYAWASFDQTSKGFIFNPAKDRPKHHPTQKPVSLYKWLLKNYAKEGDRILDTHGGSMSIAIACADMGFDLDIWELDKDYFEAAVKRLQNHVNQLNAFREVPEINIYR